MLRTHPFFFTFLFFLFLIRSAQFEASCLSVDLCPSAPPSPSPILGSSHICLANGRTQRACFFSLVEPFPFFPSPSLSLVCLWLWRTCCLLLLSFCIYGSGFAGSLRFGDSSLIRTRFLFSGGVQGCVCLGRVVGSEMWSCVAFNALIRPFHAVLSEVWRILWVVEVLLVMPKLHVEMAVDVDRAGVTSRPSRRSCAALHCACSSSGTVI